MTEMIIFSYLIKLPYKNGDRITNKELKATL